MKQLRLDKYLADMGCGSRKLIKKAMSRGLVQVNGQTVRQPEIKIDPGKDQVTYEGKQIRYERFVYYLLYKPAGCVSATEDNVHKTVMEYLPEDARSDIFPVGRLDIDTEGLLLMTNDGALAHDLLSPKKHVPKTYYAVIDRQVTDEDIRIFTEGIDIGEESLTKPGKLEILPCDNQYTGDRKVEEHNSEILLTITEGKFHQVKRMFQAVGKEVLYLRRISMANLKLDDRMKPGECRRLTEDEYEHIRTYKSSNF